MAVDITIDDDGHVEAKRNSGHELWSFKLDETFSPCDVDHLDEEIAWFIEIALNPYNVGGTRGQDD